MMNMVDTIFGTGEQLTMLQMGARSAVTFIISLILIRLGGTRVIAKRSTFDTIIIISMGSVLARGIVGASPYFSTVVAATVMVLISRILAWMVAKSTLIAGWVCGKPLLLYDNGQVLWENMRVASLSLEDLKESLRLETKSEKLDNIRQAFLETNGRISFILASDK
ncbi:DUF421 domain-containing protein [Chitinophaga sp. Ak27]|nr:YetF domain-containing protein [Chitinophaga sp. Ak27]NLU96156.1 DUF421 domain-containing protein [Chitinophaga sp. Ak27]